MANVNTFSIVKNVKLDLGIEDDNQDQLLEMLLNRITDHFKAN